MSFRIVESQGADWKNYRFFQNDDGVNLWRPSPILLKKDASSELQCYEPAALKERILLDDSRPFTPLDIDCQFLMHAGLRSKTVTATFTPGSLSSNGLYSGNDVDYGAVNKDGVRYCCLSPLGAFGDELFNRTKPLTTGGSPTIQTGYTRVKYEGHNWSNDEGPSLASHTYLGSSTPEGGATLLAGLRRYCFSFAMALSCERLKLMVNHYNVDVCVLTEQPSVSSFFGRTSLRKIVGVDGPYSNQAYYRKSEQTANGPLKCEVWGENLATKSVILIRGSLYLVEPHSCPGTYWDIFFFTPWIYFPVSAVEFVDGATSGTMTIKYCEVAESWVPTKIEARL